MFSKTMIDRRALLATTAASVLVGSDALAQSSPVRASAASDTEWRHYAADQANTRYAPLDQINASNFSQLEVAWRFKTDALGARKEYLLESTPLLAKGRLFTTAGSRRDCISLDAATGELLWMHRIDEGRRAQNAPRQLSGHGCTYWTDGAKERVLYVTIGYQLVSLDAKTGIPDPAFGVNGVVDLKQNIDQDLDLETADIGLHSTPLVVGNSIIVGAAHLTGDAPIRRQNVRGYVRSFDIATGKRNWIFHTIPLKGEFGYDTWLDGSEGAGNTGVWAQMSADEELGLVYLPVELPTGDYQGFFRRGDGLFGESLVAVDARTGQRRWHYQFVHHGIWDNDVPCAPILCDIPHEGRTIKALAQPSKQGFLYVLDRTNGKPVWPIVERKVKAGDIPGEWYSPTQPFPTRPPAYEVQGIDVDKLIDFTPALRAEAVELIKHYVTGPLFTPPSISKADGLWGTLLAPGVQGGTNWPGGAYDPETHKVYVYSKRTLAVYAAIKNDDPKISAFPYIRGLAGVAPRAAGPQVAEAGSAPPTIGPGTVTVQGLPLLKPPYGSISAIDLEKGDISWQVAHGETPDNIKNHPALKGLTIPRTGREGNLGPLCTKSLLICGEAGFYNDPLYGRGAMLRAYDKATGEEKGQVFMPAPQSGSPMTYMLGGRQYIVVAIGGGTYSGEFVAYRLPRSV